LARAAGRISSESLPRARGDGPTQLPTAMNTVLDDLAAELRARRYRHLVLWIGSFVSAHGDGESTICPDVPALRDGLVLRALQRRLAAMRQDWKEPSERVLKLAVPNSGDQENPGRIAGLRSAMKCVVPFEQFMGCLASSEDGSRTTDLIRLAFQDDRSILPNVLHRLIGQMVHGSLAVGFVERVTVVTTNYDRLLECALARCKVADAPWQDSWESERRTRGSRGSGTARTLPTRSRSSSRMARSRSPTRWCSRSTSWRAGW